MKVKICTGFYAFAFTLQTSWWAHQQNTLQWESHILCSDTQRGPHSRGLPLLTRMPHTV